MKPPLILQKIRSKPATVWATSAAIALVNRLIYTLTIACIPDLLQRSMKVPRASNGIITAAFGIGGLLGGGTIGYISDRFQTRLIPQLTAAFLYVVAGIVFFFSKQFYQIVIFRIILGVASSIADTMLFTTVADVYPAKLLGFKMAVLFVFDNIGNMMGPILGGKAYEKMGVGGIGIIAMGLGVAEMLMILVFVRNSLDIRQAQTRRFTVSQATSASDVLVIESTIVSSTPSSSDLQKTATEDCVSVDAPSVLESTRTEQSGGGQGVPMWRILLKLQVLGPTVSIFVATGLQSVIETVFPLRLFDRFGYSPEVIGFAFLIVGGILILAMPLVGWLNDRAVSQLGEHMRFYMISLGALFMLISLVITALAPRYSVLVFGYAVFGVTSMVAVVPAQSAFGDFINAGGEGGGMAQAFSLAWLAEGLANIVLPPVASGLYATVGWLPMLMVLGGGLCVACAAAVLAFPLRCIWRSRQERLRGD
ncbi:hypothetical protein GGI15_003460 [Coemansia interrupta]|uniref:Major facilitator superfamily (MFS) profile domain-containing protein n=1 Tax=Coemansia interrupta TaxID=1126814 RepID=A0A9W8LHG7_9FUNG|nr:hypothetical protein GGI15_003460 [Coemansia interrupta]